MPKVSSRSKQVQVNTLNIAESALRAISFDSTQKDQNFACSADHSLVAQGLSHSKQGARAIAIAQFFV